MRYLIVMFAAVAMMLGCAFSDAFAQTIPQWERANDACRGEPLTASGKLPPACKERDAIGRALIKQGWMPANHDVWISPEQQTWFAQVLRHYDAQTRDNLYAVDSLVPALLIELRRELPDAQIFAIWNEQRPAIQAYAPFGAALMTSMMQKLAMAYARKNDPRYYLEQ